MSARRCTTRGDLAGAALDALGPAEHTSVRRHAAACPPCGHDLARFAEAAAALALAAPPVAPRPACKTRLLTVAAATRSRKETSS